MKSPLLLVGVVTLLIATGCSQETAGESAESSTPAPSAAQSGDPSANEISSYELTLDGVRRWMVASRNLAQAAENNPSVGEAPDDGNASTAEMIAWFERTPAAREALRSAGITPRDYVMTTSAYIQAGMTEAMLGAYKDAQPPAGQNMRNVEFIRSNRAQLYRMARELGLNQEVEPDDS